MNVSIVVHGGAHAIAPEKVEATKAGCAAAARAGWSVLDAGGSALDAVEAAIRALEDDPTFNAGYGSELNTEGRAQMDAALMDGATLAAGAVGGIEGVRHPVSVARRVLAAEPVLLVAEGARRFAAEQEGAELCDPAEMVSEERRRAWEQERAEKDRKKRGHDTVGCVALDRHGGLAAGTSTGGTNTNQPGRIGDSPLVGCGLYADNTLGACSMTGDGESIVRVVLAKTAVDLLRNGGHPDEAAQQAMNILRERVDGRAGCILLDPAGRVGWAHNEPNIAVAYQTTGMDAPRAFVHKDEERQTTHGA
jgi:beta-aspartyl-peptidase (threonine type)